MRDTCTLPLQKARMDKDIIMTNDLDIWIWWTLPHIQGFTTSHSFIDCLVTYCAYLQHVQLFFLTKTQFYIGDKFKQFKILDSCLGNDGFGNYCAIWSMCSQWVQSTLSYFTNCLRLHFPKYLFTKTFLQIAIVWQTFLRSMTVRP